MSWQRRARDDAGAATIETTGAWALAALLVVGVVFALLATVPGTAETVRRAICMVVTLGEGACGGAPAPQAADRTPTEPCVTRADGRESTVKGAFTFVSASTGEQWMVEELSDGTFRVTRGTSGAVGLEAGVGVTAHVVVDDKGYGITAAAGVAGELGFRSGEVYAAGDQAAVDALLRQHGVDVVADNVIGAAGPVRSVVDALGDLVGLDDYQLPEPSARYVEGGIALSATAQATGIYLSGKAGVETSTTLGVRIARNGSTTEYLASTVSGEVAAGGWAAADDGSSQYAQIKAQGSVRQVLELDRDADGNVTAVRSKLITAGEAGATFGDAGPKGSTYTERVTTLPIKTDADRRVALGFLAAAGVQQVSGLAGPLAPVVALPAAVTAAAFSSAAGERGQITDQTFDASSTSYGGEFGIEAVAKAGGGVNVGITDRSSTGGRYWDGAGWQPWTACG